MKGITTHEKLRAMPFEDELYSSNNPCKNIYHILCRPHNKSYIGRRKFAEEEYDVQPHASNSNLSTTIQDEIFPH